MKRSNFGVRISYSTTALLLLLTFSFTPLQIHAANGFFTTFWCNITELFGFTCEAQEEIVVTNNNVVTDITPHQETLPPPESYVVTNYTDEAPVASNFTTEEHITYTTNPTTIVYQNPQQGISDSEFLNLFQKLIKLIGKTEPQEHVVLRDLFDKQVDKIYEKSNDGNDNVQENLDTIQADNAANFSTELLTVTGNTAVGGDITVTGDSNLDGDTTIGGDLNVIGTITAGALNVSALASEGALIAPYFTATSTTDVNSFMGNVGIGTTTPNSKLTVIGNSYLNGSLTLTGALKDSTSATGTLGMILKTTGTSTQWVATSTLGLGNGTFIGLSDTQDTLTANRLIFTNSGATALTDSANLTFDGTNFGVGTQNGIAFGGTRYIYASSTNDSITFGENAGETFNSGTTYNIAFGSEAGRYASTSASDYNNFIGNQAGYSNTGERNNIIGITSGLNNTGSQNNLFGTAAGYNNTGSYNNIIGYWSGLNSTGSYNNFIGYQTSYKNIGNYNEIIGYQAGYNLQSTSSVIFGTEAYRGGAGVLAFQAVNNVALGYQAGYSARTGADNNILIGYKSADNITTGANNIVIGYDVDIASTTRSNQLNIGNLIFGTGIDGTGTTLSSGNVGIGTTTPSSKLSVIGSTYLNGDLTVTGTSTFSNGLIMSGTVANIILGSNWLSSDGDDEGVYVNNIGDVSIGTTTAVAKFNVSGNIYVPNNNSFVTNDASGNTVSLLSMTTANNVLITGSTVSGNLILGVPNDVGAIQFETGSGLNSVMKILNNGNIGIGTTTPSAKLSVTQSTDTATGGFWLANVDNSDFRSQFMSATSGVLSFYGGDTAGTLNTATLNAAGEWTNASDVSYKDNIENLSNGLDIALALNPRTYDIKNTDNHRIGFIAQEVEDIVPEVVSGEDGSKGISYGNLVAVAIGAIQELAEKISGFANIFKSERIETETLCVGGTCVTETELQELLKSKQIETNNGSNNNVNTTSEPVIEVPVDVITTVVVDEEKNDNTTLVESPVTEPEPEPELSTETQ